jgi:hypothetical protein
MRILLIQLDGKLPNIALMRIAMHHRRRGDDVAMWWGASFESNLLAADLFDRIYASAIFRKTLPLVARLRALLPQAIVGGTGVDPWRKGELIELGAPINNKIETIEAHGIEVGEGAVDLDYSFYPQYTASIGFSQRGCRKKCSFCCVWVKEPVLKSVQGVHAIWRGKGHPKHLHLLDNDFFGQPEWRTVIRDIRDGGFKVSFNQGINARFLTDESAEAIASVDYRADDMKVKRIYTAWDNLQDEEILFAGLNRLVKYGVKPDHIMVYILCGFWPYDQKPETWNLRRQKLRDFGARPYPMPFVRTKELVGFQRFVIGAYDKRYSWNQFVQAGYRPEKLHLVNRPLFTSDSYAEILS